jgi:hypothetical protein
MLFVLKTSIALLIFAIGMSATMSEYRSRTSDGARRRFRRQFEKARRRVWLKPMTNFVVKAFVRTG